MEFKDLQKELITAMKAKDKTRKEAISALVSAAKKMAIDSQSRDNITQDIVDQAILKELKTAKEQLETCPPDRTDLKEQYQAYYDVIAAYAPKQMSEEEVRKVLTTQFADVLATKNRGQIMKAVMPQLKGKADGKMIQKIVGEFCQ